MSSQAVGHFHEGVVGVGKSRGENHGNAETTQKKNTPSFRRMDFSSRVWRRSSPELEFNVITAHTQISTAKFQPTCAAFTPSLRSGLSYYEYKGNHVNSLAPIGRPQTIHETTFTDQYHCRFRPVRDVFIIVIFSIAFFFSTNLDPPVARHTRLLCTGL